MIITNDGGRERSAKGVLTVLAGSHSTVLGPRKLFEILHALCFGAVG